MAPSALLTGSTGGRAGPALLLPRADLLAGDFRAGDLAGNLAGDLAAVAFPVALSTALSLDKRGAAVFVPAEAATTAFGRDRSFGIGFVAPVPKEMNMDTPPGLASTGLLRFASLRCHTQRHQSLTE